jgi:arginyl-tRNA synthetase
MGLARSLKKNPRDVARPWSSAAGRPAVQRWVAALEIAGPGFVNVRLKPAARQSVVARCWPAVPASATRPTAAAT